MTARHYLARLTLVGVGRRSRADRTTTHPEEETRS
jgi:hypothetical protein